MIFLRYAYNWPTDEEKEAFPAQMPQPFIDFSLRHYMHALRRVKFHTKEEMTKEFMSYAQKHVKNNRIRKRKEVVDFFLVSDLLALNDYFLSTVIVKLNN